MSSSINNIPVPDQIIMEKIFTRPRQALTDNTESRLEIAKIRAKQDKPNPPGTRIGFKPGILIILKH